MKKFVILSIFSCLMVLSLQQITFAETEEYEKQLDEAESARAEISAKAAREQKAAEETREQKAAEKSANAARAEEIAKAGDRLKRDGGMKKEETKIEEEVNEKTERKKIPSKLKKLLPTEKELEKITNRTIWRYVDNQSTIDEGKDMEIMTSILRDISRVYDPVVNKYKVATIQIKIIKYEDQDIFKNYWYEETSTNIEEIFNNAYLIGSPDRNTNCMFNFSEKGAITMCRTNEYTVQSIISDEYQEHFDYNKLKIGTEKLQLTQDEITTRIVNEILKKIGENKDIKKNYELYKTLELNQKDKEKEFRDNEISKRELDENEEKIQKENRIKDEQNKNKLLGIEKDKKYGIQNFSCVKDEFGLVTISGQFNNNEIKKDKVILEILFLDYEQNIIFKNNANLLEIDEFETKRFLGNTKIDKSFFKCTINAKF